MPMVSASLSLRCMTAQMELSCLRRSFRPPLVLFPESNQVRRIRNRSEEHTSELQSLPPRRSSDLVTVTSMHDCADGTVMFTPLFPPSARTVPREQPSPPHPK